VRDTLAHILAPNGIWLERFQAARRLLSADTTQYPDIATLAALGRFEPRLLNFVRNLTQSDLDGIGIPKREVRRV